MAAMVAVVACDVNIVVTMVAVVACDVNIVVALHTHNKQLEIYGVTNN